MADPFGILLSAGVSWATGRVLDALLDCLSCAYTHPREIQNKEVNYLSCPECGNSLPQYVNVCDYTLDSVSGRVGASGISGIWWDSWGGLFNPSFKPHLKVWTLDLRGRDQVVRLKLGELGGGSFYSYDVVLNSRLRYQRSNVWFSVPRHVFPRYSTTVTVDLEVLSEYNDLLTEWRSLMNYAYHSPTW